MKKINANKTDYPKIFENTYRGNHRYKKNDRKIILNRNELVTDYGIKKELKYFYNFTFMSDLVLDHMEIYECKNGKAIILFSPYNSNINLNDTKLKMIKIGFSETYKLYCNSATTFIGVFENIKKMEAFLKTFEKWAHMK